MILDHTHPEDVKAALRKRFGTISAFIAAKGLPTTGVADVLRGRVSKRVREAIEEVLKEQSESISLDDSEPKQPAHRLIEVAR